MRLPQIAQCLWLLAMLFALGLSANSLAQSSAPDAATLEVTQPGIQERLQNLLDKDGAGAITKSCCKICRKGKACGHSCISRNYRCNQPPGCACDG